MARFIHKKRSVRPLHIYTDEDGLLRVASRSQSRCTHRTRLRFVSIYDILLLLAGVGTVTYMLLGMPSF